MLYFISSKEIEHSINFYIPSLFSVDALKCWRCSSDSATSAFCDDTFDSSIIDETVRKIFFCWFILKQIVNLQKRRWAYVDCTYPVNPYGQNQQPFGYGQNSNNRPVCKKMKQLSKYFFHMTKSLINSGRHQLTSQITLYNFILTFIHQINFY